MPDWLSNLADHWWWVGAGALLGILEILLPGIFLIWVALAAWVTALSSSSSRSGLAWQLASSSLLAFVIVLVGRQYYARNPVESADPNLNVRASRLIGQTRHGRERDREWPRPRPRRRRRLERHRPGRAERRQGADRRGGRDVADGGVGLVGSGSA